LKPRGGEPGVGREGGTTHSAEQDVSRYWGMSESSAVLGRLKSVKKSGMFSGEKERGEVIISKRKKREGL